MAKYCRYCGIRLNDQNWYSGFKENRNYICKKCEKKRRNKYKKFHKEKVSQQARQRDLKYKYGLAQKQYEEMLRLQDYRCAICGRKFTKSNPACVDHNHKTKEVRGILCRKCNTAIGFLEDDPILAYKAFDYLAKRQ